MTFAHKTTLKSKLLALLVLTVAGMALVVSSATAHHHGKAIVDTDADGAAAACETQAGTDPTVADTDGNGIVDGLEDSDSDGANNAAESLLHSNCANANKNFRVRRATISSFTDGKLTLAIGKTGLLTAPVSTRVVCEIDDPEGDVTAPTGATAKASKHGGGESGDDNGGGRNGKDDNQAEDNHRSSEHAGNHEDNHAGHGDDDNTVACVATDYAVGTKVRNAKVRHGRFVKLELKSVTSAS